jgi:hypothetical protein
MLNPTVGMELSIKGGQLGIRSHEAVGDELGAVVDPAPNASTIAESRRHTRG